jgi:hypothetical protein
MQLGAANSTSGNIVEGSSDRFALTGEGDGQLAFNLTNFDFLGTGSAGFYKLIDLSNDHAGTYMGLDFNPNSGTVLAGLTYSGLANGLSARFVVGTEANGGTTGDLYLQVVPEPTSVALTSAGVAMLGFVRRRRSARS